MAPRKGEISLKSLQQVFSLFGIEPNALRTALSRLANDEWLIRNRYGRHSTYRLSNSGADHFRSATGRIYKSAPSGWDGEFELILQTSGDRKQKEQLRRKLVARGFGSPLNGVFIRPLTEDPGPLVPDSVSNAILRMQDYSAPAELVANAWPLESLNAAYRRLEKRFRKLESEIENGEKLSREDCLVLRILLIHEWRRVLLKDVDIPAVYKLSDWRGETSRKLVANLYHTLLPKSEELLSSFESRPGITLPNSDSSLCERFR